ncbi:NIPSNAP family protein [Diaphorobacter caeni]|uniref:NIPSNAP family protein n=1 Tax=Diaphorobacter caeni TaxID=2784387 RepID=UPI00188FAC79|nr:NIPSNAP family protein [Diaphorobacter caeni]MBF5007257.1 NIPSNAP family protein [Diaphorobacter caeni]
MILEERCYTLGPTSMRPFLSLYEKEGLSMLLQHLGDLKGFFTTETGELNQVVHLWGFSDLVEREQRRARLWSDPKWIAYADKVLPLIVRMETRFLRPASFSPMR